MEHALIVDLDLETCRIFCFRMNLIPSCEEEHEAWHAYWIEAAVSREEYLLWMQMYS